MTKKPRTGGKRASVPLSVDPKDVEHVESRTFDDFDFTAEETAFLDEAERRMVNGGYDVVGRHRRHGEPALRAKNPSFGTVFDLTPAPDCDIAAGTYKAKTTLFGAAAESKEEEPSAS